MEETKDPDKAPESITEKFKMEPPAAAWNALDADLERRSAALYRTKANRFRLLSIGLAALLISFLSFYFLSTPRQSKTAVVVVDQPKIADNNKAIAAQQYSRPQNSKGAVTNNGAVINANQGSSEKTSEPATSVAEKNNSFNVLKREEQANVSSSAKTGNHLGENKSQRKDAQQTVNKPIAVAAADNAETNSQPVHDLTNDGNQVSATDDKLKGEKAQVDQTTLTAATMSPVLNENKNPVTEPAKEDLKQDNSAESNSPAAGTNETTDPGNTSPPVLAQEAAKENASKDSVTNMDGASISRWSLSAFYAPHYSRNRLTDNNSYDSENPNEYNSREKSQYSFSTGLLLRYYLTQRWSISAGVAYSTMSYSISIPTIYANKTSDNKVHYQYPTSCGIITMPSSSHSYLHNGDSLNINAGCEQVLEFIKVPLSARYQIPLKSLLFYADAGFSANFLLREKANVTYGNSEITIVNNIDGLKKVNYSVLFGIGVEYGFYKNIGIFIEPIYSTAITSLTENISMNCYPYSFGLNAGLTIHF